MKYGTKPRDTTYLVLHGNYQSGDSQDLEKITEFFRYDIESSSFILTESRQLSGLVKRIKFD